MPHRLSPLPCLPFRLIERIVWGWRVWYGFHFRPPSSASIASDAVAETFQLRIPAPTKRVSAEPKSIIDMNFSAPAGDAEVCLVLDEVIEAPETGVGGHVTGVN